MQQELPEIGAPLAGGFFAGRININDNQFALIVSPKDVANFADIAWNASWSKVDGAKSFCDGMSNTRAMAEAGSELAQTILGLEIGGFNDWYLPSQDELEILYRNLKPFQDENYLFSRSGINLSAIPPTYPYTEEAPRQVGADEFKGDGAQAFDADWFWSSTQHAGSSAYVWIQNFVDGTQCDGCKENVYRARAVRRVPI